MIGKTMKWVGLVYTIMVGLSVAAGLAYGWHMYYTYGGTVEAYTAIFNQMQSLDATIADYVYK